MIGLHLNAETIEILPQEHTFRVLEIVKVAPCRRVLQESMREKSGLRLADAVRPKEERDVQCGP